MGKFDFEKNPANYRPLTPVAYLPRTALMYPDRASIIYGDRNYTWAETYARCCKFASALKKAGIGKGDTVSIIGRYVYHVNLM